MSSVLRRLAFVLVVAGVAAGPAAAADVDVNVITSGLHVSNVVPTWGAQIPKLAYDGGWYYASTLDSDDNAKYPWRGIIYKSRDGKTWTKALEMNDPSSDYVCTTCGSTQPSHGLLYQPIALFFDNQHRLHLQVGCWNGGECYPGIPSPPGSHTYIYTLRLIFSDRLADGSIDFSRYADRSLRAPAPDGAPISRYYQGLATDPTGRYIYAAFAGFGSNDSPSSPADSVGPVWFNVFDTQTETDVFTSKIGVTPGPTDAPPCGRGWIYVRVRPGLAPGEIYLSFQQVVLCESYVNSAPIDAAWLWRSTDGGRTFPERVKTAEVPYADGYTSWVDSTDSTVDSRGVVHAISYKRSNAVSTMLYQEGMHGTPVTVGQLDNHSQLVVTPAGGRLIFSNQGFAGDNYGGRRAGRARRREQRRRPELDADAVPDACVSHSELAEPAQPAERQRRAAACAQRTGLRDDARRPEPGVERLRHAALRPLLGAHPHAEPARQLADRLGHAAA